jgi:hypothetical protein
MANWTNEQKAAITLQYFRNGVARCPLDKAALRVDDVTGDGDPSTRIAAYCPLCANDMDSAEVQTEIAAAVHAPPTRASPMTTTAAPKAFMSYSWDSDEHKLWVKELATRLRGDGVDVQLDQWSVVPGDQLPKFMETAIRDNSYVIIICTPKYKSKSDDRAGGVGYEGDVMTGEVHTQQNHRKFIPVLRCSKEALPSWLSGKYRIDLSTNPYSEEQYKDLVVTLHNQREQAPPLGKPPPNVGSKTNPWGFTTKSPRDEAQKFYFNREEVGESGFQPIQIHGLLADEVGQPRRDGTPGSALYEVPLKLNRTPPGEWCEFFVRAWDHPSSFTSMHRPGIAEVSGDRIILTRTTLEELRDVHRDTLKLAVTEANNRMTELITKRRIQEERARQQDAEHRDRVRRIADDITF